jgi:hypothetical protein
VCALLFSVSDLKEFYTLFYTRGRVLGGIGRFWADFKFPQMSDFPL